MKEKKSIAVIGTGAIGGYYGALLQRAGHDLHYLLHTDYHHVCQHGLTISSPNGNFTLPQVNAYRSACDMPPCDITLITLKTVNNHLLPNILEHVMKGTGIALTLQNGLGVEEQIAKIIGNNRVLGGLCFICSSKTGPGQIAHQDYGLITLGEFSKQGITPRTKTIAQLLNQASIPAQAIDDLNLARWKKLVWNIPFNGLSVIHNGLTDQLIKSPILRDQTIKLMQEVAQAAAACAGTIDSAFIDKMISNTENMVPYAPSMKLDHDHGRPLELDAIYAEPIRQAHAAGIEMPLTQALLNQLSELNT